MCERRDGLKAVTEAADRLAATCIEQGEARPSAEHARSTPALRHAFKPLADTPNDMLKQMRELK